MAPNDGAGLPRFTSRKFLAGALLIVFAITGYATGQLTFEQAAQVAQYAVTAYLIAEGAVDVAAQLRRTPPAPPAGEPEAQP